MSAVAGKTTTGKVWHVAVWAGPTAVPLCTTPEKVNPVRLLQFQDLDTVPAFGLCQKCERASEQIAADIRSVQS